MCYRGNTFGLIVSVVMLVLLAGCVGIGGVSDGDVAGGSYGSMGDVQSDASFPVPGLALPDEYSFAGATAVAGSYRMRYTSSINGDVYYRAKETDSERPYIDVNGESASVETIDLNGVTGYVQTRDTEVEVVWHVGKAGYSLTGPVSDRDVLVTAARTTVQNTQ